MLFGDSSRSVFLAAFQSTRVMNSSCITVSYTGKLDEFKLLSILIYVRAGFKKCGGSHPSLAFTIFMMMMMMMMMIMTLMKKRGNKNAFLRGRAYWNLQQ